MTDFSLIVNLIEAVGFPIFACCFMFYNNNKLIKELSKLNSILEILNDRINRLEDKKGSEKNQ